MPREINADLTGCVLCESTATTPDGGYFTVFAAGVEQESDISVLEERARKAFADLKDAHGGLFVRRQPQISHIEAFPGEAGDPAHPERWVASFRIAPIDGRAFDPSTTLLPIKPEGQNAALI
jgi:hypothetical protein